MGESPIRIKPSRRRHNGRPGGFFFVGLLLVVAACAPGESVGPTTDDIWVVDVFGAGGLRAIGTPVRVTDRDGYDSQPSFLPDGGSLLYSSRRGNQVDVILHDLESGEEIQPATTLESEYSAVAAEDGLSYTVVRVEADGRQRVWRFPISGDVPAPVLETPDRVGYYAWIGDRLALTVLGRPAVLLIADPATGEISPPVAADVGRSLSATPGSPGAVTFVHEPADGSPEIRLFDPSTGETTTLTPVLDGARDFAWTPDGSLLMAREATLYEWHRDLPTWTQVADFADQGLGPISRISVSPDGARWAIVAGRVER